MLPRANLYHLLSGHAPQQAGIKRGQASSTYLPILSHVVYLQIALQNGQKRERSRTETTSRYDQGRNSPPQS